MLVPTTHVTLFDGSHPVLHIARAASALRFPVNVNVVQPQGFGFTMFGGGWVFGQCTGQQQKLAVPVYSFGYGTWLLGDASASVVACAGPCADDTKQIHIGL